MISIAFWWIYNSVPWWVPIIVVIVLLVLFWDFIAPIWTLIPKPIKWALGFIGSIALAVQYGRNRGQQSERDHLDELNKEAIQRRDTIDADVKNMSDTDVDRDLERNGWMRDDK